MKRVKAKLLKKTVYPSVIKSKKIIARIKKLKKRIIQKVENGRRDTKEKNIQPVSDLTYVRFCKIHSQVMNRQLLDDFRHLSSAFDSYIESIECIKT